MAPRRNVTFRVAPTALRYGGVLLVAYGIGYCSATILAGTGTGLVHCCWNWNEGSKSAVLLMRVCGVLVLPAGLYPIYRA